jgi:hypothetical protein
MIQSVARKVVTTGTVGFFLLPYLLTVLDAARDSGFSFGTVAPSATRASLVISCIGITETAVHSTGSDQRFENRLCLYRSFRHPIRVPARAFLVIRFNPICAPVHLPNRGRMVLG